MKKIVFFLFPFLAVQAGAQKNMEGLIKAEKNFAAYSVANNTKDAFLKFLDSAGVVFENGKAVNGIEAWNKKEKRAGILNWHPQFAEIAASGDLGYTTGPWTFQPKTSADSVIARGQYTTIWRADSDGEWKFLLDLGTGNLPSTDSSEVQKIDAPKVPTKPINLFSLVKTEEKFIKAYKKNVLKAYQQFLSSQSILNRNGALPAVTAENQQNVIAATPASLNFAIGHSGISTSGDLGFVYGSTAAKDKPENYLHIWRREKEGWKLALEVLRY